MGRDKILVRGVRKNFGKFWTTEHHQHPEQLIYSIPEYFSRDVEVP